MDSGIWWMALVVAGVAAGCSGDVVAVHGRVVRATSATSDDDPVAFGPGSVARVQLLSTPALGGDASSTVIDEQTFSPAPQLPFKFELRGSREPDSGYEQYFVEVEVLQDPSTSTVGDLMSESFNEVQPPEDDLVVEVLGLESCQAPNAGGFCTQP